MRKMFALASSGLALVLASPAAAAPCPAPPSADNAVTAAVTAMYAAAAKDDLDGFHAVTTPDFYAFDGGRRFDGDALMRLIRTAHAGGVKFTWSVTQPQVEADCGLALITYVNAGSMTANGVTQPVTWLEAAELRYDGGSWRIHFFSSTRVPQPQVLAKPQ